METNQDRSESRKEGLETNQDRSKSFSLLEISMISLALPCVVGKQRYTMLSQMISTYTTRLIMVLIIIFNLQTGMPLWTQDSLPLISCINASHEHTNTCEGLSDCFSCVWPSNLQCNLTNKIRYNNKPREKNN